MYSVSPFLTLRQLQKILQFLCLPPHIPVLPQVSHVIDMTRHTDMMISILCTLHLANKDYMNTKDRVILSKDSRRVCIVIYVWDDSVAEMEEIFQCVLSRNEKFNLKLNLPIATVVLDDDDSMFVLR